MKKLALVLVSVFYLSMAAARAETGSAVIRGTADDSQVSGRVDLQETVAGLQLKAEIEGLAPGKHGFHIHECGDCSSKGDAAKGHYNPEKVSHGAIVRDGLKSAHAGDLGNIEAGLDGKAALETVIPGLSLVNGRYNVAGRAVIIHEKEDDFGQPSGNAGGRAGCGVIVITGD